MVEKKQTKGKKETKKGVSPKKETEKKVPSKEETKEKTKEGVSLRKETEEGVSLRKETEEKKEEKITKAEEEKNKIIKESDKKEDSEKTKESENKDKETEKVPEKKKQKKDIVHVLGKDLPISTKQSVAVCRYIKGREINQAIEELEEVIALKRAIPMKGEIPHKKGMMSGRYPKKAAYYFIKLLKNLRGSANNNDISNPIIIEAIANIASRPYTKKGAARKKRTHILIKCKEGGNK